MNLDREIKVAASLALEAGAALRRYQMAKTEVNYKAHGEVVTAADLEADAIIQGGLKAAFPDDAVFSEEAEDTSARLSCPRVWIIDPLDSTSNFIEHGDEYSVSIGLSVQNRAVLGVIYNPTRDELFTGYQSSGVTLNGDPARVNDVGRVDRARLTVSRKEWERGLNRLAALLPVRPLASMAYKLARVAAGLDDGVFSAKPRKEWGTCAGVSLVFAAGGHATSLDGLELSFNRRDARQPMGLIAAGPRLHKDLCASLLASFRPTHP